MSTIVQRKQAAGYVIGINRQQCGNCKHYGERSRCQLHDFPSSWTAICTHHTPGARQPQQEKRPATDRANRT